MCQCLFGGGILIGRGFSKVVGRKGSRKLNLLKWGRNLDMKSSEAEERIAKILADAV